MAGLDGTVKIPGVGTVPKKYAVLGGGVLVLIVGVLYVRHRNAASSTAATAADTTATSDTSASGAGSEYAYAPGDAYSASSVPYSPYGFDAYGNPLPAPTGTTGTGGVYATNQDWAGAAETELEKQGITLSASSAAVTRVLAGLAVSSTQKDVFLQATGLLGQPPQGYPQPIKITDTAPTPTATAPATPTGLHVSSVTKTSVALDWNPVPSAIGYRVFRGGTQVGPTVTYSAYSGGGLHAGSKYTYSVQAVNVSGKTSGKASVAVTTKK